MRKITTLLICLLLCAFVAGCGNYEGNARLGRYLSEEDGYTMTLFADGTGKMSYISTIDGEREELFHFTLRGDELLLTGTEASGAVVGRGQYSGVFEKKDGVFTVLLYNEETGIAFGRFLQVAD